jgi:non-specific protein-tyrosine kinase
MSKIFEVLQRTIGDLAESVTPVLSGGESADTKAADDAGQNSPSKLPASDDPAVQFVPELIGSSNSLDQIRCLPVYLDATDPVLPIGSSQSRASEQYRILRTKIDHHPMRPKILAVTSAASGDGKSITSINIAGAMALRTAARVLLVDADLRRSSVAAYLGLPQEPGILDVLSGDCALEDALIRVEQFPNLYVLPAGRPRQNPSELLDSPVWLEACKRFRQVFDHTILDTPPACTVADYHLIEAVADGLVVVLRPNHTKRAALKQTLATLPSSKMLGVILNDVEDWFLWRAGATYSYYGGDFPDTAQIPAPATQRAARPEHQQLPR